MKIAKKKGRQSSRFKHFELQNNTSDPDKTGLLASEQDYEFGTPSLSRNETVLLVASNLSTHERLLVKLKWRPVSASESATEPPSPLVTLISELQLTTHTGSVYESKQIETYRADELCLNKAKLKDRRIIGQYGSGASKLKLIISHPYRRSRLVFTGHMKRVSGGDGGESVFVKLGCSITPVAQIFDFLDETTTTNGRKIIPLETIYNDRHEQKVRLSGEYSLFQSAPIGSTAEKQAISLRGFYARHLSDQARTGWWRQSANLEGMSESNLGCRTRRLYVYLLNGKSFHLGIVEAKSKPAVQDDADSTSKLVQVGYTNFTPMPYCEAMKLLDGQKLSSLNAILSSKKLLCANYSGQMQCCDSAKLEPSKDDLTKCGDYEPIEVHNIKASESLTCTIKQVLGGGWLKIEAKTRFKTDGAQTDQDKREPSPGWAWLSQDDGILASPEETEAVRRSREERELAIREGDVIGDLVDEEPLDDKVVDSNEQRRQLVVVSIEDKCCTSSQLVGSKAASLAQMRQFQARTDAASSYLVPYGLVLTRHAYDMIMTENTSIGTELDHLRQLLIDESHQNDSNNGDDKLVQSKSAVRDKCNQLVALVKQFQLPTLIGDQLLDKLRAHHIAPTGAARATRFAVRSSSWGEDECDMSAAGQLTTILGVQFEAGASGNAGGSGDLKPLARAIMECFASKFSYENVQYKRQHGLPLDLPMAVIVQEMVDCDRAGVLFTCNPVTGDDSWLTITANYGLGESVVSAQADPDSIQVQRLALDAPLGARACAQFGDIQVSVGRKEVIVATPAAEADAATGREQAEYDRSQCCLSREQILRLARVAVLLERFYSSKQRHCDIEFGYLDDRLFLFQCRPVTGLEAASHEELLHECDRTPQTELVFCTRANVGEVAPHAARPLSLTYTQYNLMILNSQLHLSFQPVSGPDHLRPDQVFSPQCLAQDFIYEKYHMFLSLLGSSWLNLGDEAKSALTRSLEIGLFGREMEPQRDLIETSKCFKSAPNPFRGVRFRLKTAKLHLDPISEAERAKRATERVYSSLLNEFNQLSSTGGKPIEATSIRGGPQTAADKGKMLEYYDKMKSILAHMMASWLPHMIVSMLDSETHFSLNKLLANYIDDPLKLCAAVNKFLGAAKGDVISAQVPERIRRMAELIKRQDGGTSEEGSSCSSLLTVDKFLKMSSKEALEYLTSTEKQGDTELRREFGDFLQRLGHRCYGEFDVAFKTWREQPEQIVDMIKTNCVTQAESTTKSANKGSNSSSNKLSFKEVLKSIQPNLTKRLTRLDKLRLKYFLVPRCQLLLATRERTKNVMVMHIGCQRLIVRMLAREMHRQMRLPDEDLFYYLMFDQVEPLCHAHSPAIIMAAQKRRQLFRRVFPVDQVWKFDEIIRSRHMEPNHMKANEATIDEATRRAPKLYGTPASPGRVRGKICLIRNYQELNRIQSGSILLTHSTDIAFSPVFPLITGIITEVGGLISHGAVVAREYGLPSVIGIPNVTQILQDGEEILLDADNGTILRLDAAPLVSSGGPVEEGGAQASERANGAL